jgi:hypothetical protein
MEINEEFIVDGQEQIQMNIYLLQKRINFTSDKLQSINDITAFWMQRWARIDGFYYIRSIQNNSSNE